MDLKKFRICVNVNAGILETSIPTLSVHGKEFFPSETTFACLRCDGKDIAINKDMQLSTQDIMFVMSHEMRHLWQLENGNLPNEILTRYTASVADYNKQDHELDANAYGTFIVREIFHVEPVGFGKSIGESSWCEIKRRSYEIQKEYEQKLIEVVESMI